jgi:hypothetical protein
MVAEFMDFLSGFSTANEGVTAYLGSAAPRAAMIKTGLGLGLGRTTILASMRAAGFGMRTQNFYQLTNQLIEDTSAGSSWQWGGPGTTIDPSDVRQIEGGRAGQYMVNVRSYYTTVDEDGEIESGYTVSSVLQDEVDMDQAVADAQQLQGGRYTGSVAGQGMITGWDISSVVQWQGK